jgi:glutathione synthase/RimK-type ligase-like ATP-grasp enzyme
MKLLKITDREIPELDRHFEDVEKVSIEEVAPEVIDNEPYIRVKDIPIKQYDAVYANIPEKNAVFGRVLLEVIEEKGIPVNYSSTSFFAMSKKNYLYSVLHDKNVLSPKTAVIGDEKSARNLENHLKGPLVARKFEGFEESERKKIDTVEDIGGFTEGIEYGENFILFQEFSNGDKYRCLVAGENLVSLEDSSDSWAVGKESLRYSNIPNDIEDLVIKAKRSLGTRTAEVLVRDEEIIDVNPNPDLDIYADISGKDVYKMVAEAMKNGMEED